MSDFPGLVDSHFHSLSLLAKGLDPAQCLREFFAGGGLQALDVAVDTQGFDQRVALLAGFPDVWLTAGLHPSEAPLATDDAWRALEAQLAHPRCVAVGELGLDWYRGRQHEAAQKSVLARQLQMALRLGKPVVIHNREADADLLEQLDLAPGTRGVLHCFSSTREMARAGLDRGLYLSFAGNVTYPSAGALRDVARWVPLDRLLVETDAPYLTPQPRRGQPNRPLNAGYTAEVVAEARGVELSVVLEASARNFQTLMGVEPTGRAR